MEQLSDGELMKIALGGRTPEAATQLPSLLTLHCDNAGRCAAATTSAT
jgi:hypothetical protein